MNFTTQRKTLTLKIIKDSFSMSLRVSSGLISQYRPANSEFFNQLMKIRYTQI